MSTRCATCKYFTKTIPRPTKSIGECHRYPPESYNRVRQVYDDNWCGEYTPITDTKPEPVEFITNTHANKPR